MALYRHLPIIANSYISTVYGAVMGFFIAGGPR